MRLIRLILLFLFLAAPAATSLWSQDRLRAPRFLRLPTLPADTAPDYMIGITGNPTLAVPGIAVPAPGAGIPWAAFTGLLEDAYAYDNLTVAWDPAAAAPTEPQGEALPAVLNDGILVIERRANAQLFWRREGAAWVIKHVNQRPVLMASEFGFTADKTEAQNATTFDTILDAAGLTGIHTVVLDAGTYRLGPVVVDDDLTLVGQGTTRTTIDARAVVAVASPTPLIDINAGAGMNVEFRDLRILGPDVPEVIEDGGADAFPEDGRLYAIDYDNAGLGATEKFTLRLTRVLVEEFFYGLYSIANQPHGLDLYIDDSEFVGQTQMAVTLFTNSAVPHTDKWLRAARSTFRDNESFQILYLHPQASFELVDCVFDGGREAVQTFQDANINQGVPDTVTIAGHSLIAGHGVRATSDGTLPTGLVAGTNYYIDIPNPIGAPNDVAFRDAPGGAFIELTGVDPGVNHRLTPSFTLAAIQVRSAALGDAGRKHLIQGCTFLDGDQGYSIYTDTSGTPKPHIQVLANNFHVDAGNNVILANGGVFAGNDVLGTLLSSNFLEAKKDFTVSDNLFTSTDTGVNSFWIAAVTAGSRGAITGNVFEYPEAATGARGIVAGDTSGGIATFNLPRLNISDNVFRVTQSTAPAVFVDVQGDGQTRITGNTVRGTSFTGTGTSDGGLIRQRTFFSEDSRTVVNNNTFDVEGAAGVTSGRWFGGHGRRESRAFTANAGTNELTTTGVHGYIVGESFRVTTLGVLPAGTPNPMAANTTYFVLTTPTTTTLTFSATRGGAVFDITDAGTGAHTIHTHRPGAVDLAGNVMVGAHANVWNPGGFRWNYRVTRESEFLDAAITGRWPEVFISGTVTLSASRSTYDAGRSLGQPDDPAIHMLDGGTFAQGAAHTLELGGDFDAHPNQHVFVGFSPGQVTLRRQNLERSPDWWGALGIQNSDDSVAIQSAIQSGPGAGPTTTSGTPVHICLHRNYYLSAPIRTYSGSATWPIRMSGNTRGTAITANSDFNDPGLFNFPSGLGGAAIGQIGFMCYFGGATPANGFGFQVREVNFNCNNVVLPGHDPGGGVYRYLGGIWLGKPVNEQSHFDKVRVARFSGIGIGSPGTGDPSPVSTHMTRFTGLDLAAINETLSDPTSPSFVGLNRIAQWCGFYIPQAKRIIVDSATFNARTLGTTADCGIGFWVDADVVNLRSIHIENCGRGVVAQKSSTLNQIECSHCGTVIEAAAGSSTSPTIIGSNAAAPTVSNTASKINDATGTVVTLGNWDFTADPVTDRLTTTGDPAAGVHGMAANDIFRVSSTGTLPSGPGGAMLPNQNYFVLTTPTTTTLTFSTSSGGAVFDIDNAGAPTHTLQIWRTDTAPGQPVTINQSAQGYTALQVLFVLTHTGDTFTASETFGGPAFNFIATGGGDPSGNLAGAFATQKSLYDVVWDEQREFRWRGDPVGTETRYLPFYSRSRNYTTTYSSEPLIQQRIISTSPFASSHGGRLTDYYRTNSVIWLFDQGFLDATVGDNADVARSISPGTVRAFKSLAPAINPDAVIASPAYGRRVLEFSGNESLGAEISSLATYSIILAIKPDATTNDEFVLTDWLGTAPANVSLKTTAGGFLTWGQPGDRVTTPDATGITAGAWQIWSVIHDASNQTSIRTNGYRRVVGTHTATMTIGSRSAGLNDLFLMSDRDALGSNGVDGQVGAVVVLNYADRNVTRLIEEWLADYFTIDISK